MDQANGVELPIIGAEGIGTNQFRQAIGLVGFGLSDRAHLMENNGHARTADLPSRFAACKAAADDVNGFYLSHRLFNSAAFALRGGGGLSRHSLMLSSLTKGRRESTIKLV
jgi:hypothetical protein